MTLHHRDRDSGQPADLNQCAFPSNSDPESANLSPEFSFTKLAKRGVDGVRNALSWPFRESKLRSLNEEVLIHRAREENEEAIEAARAALQFAEKRFAPLDPLRLKAAEVLGTLLFDSGDLEGAEQILQRALEASPENTPATDLRVPQLLKHLGYIQFTQGKADEALKNLKCAAQLFEDAIDPEEPSGEAKYGLALSHGLMGRQYGDLERFDEAIESFELALESAQNMDDEHNQLVATYHEQLGRLHLTRANFDQAREHFEATQLLREDLPNASPTDHGHSLLNFAKLHRYLDDLDAAEGFARRARIVAQGDSSHVIRSKSIHLELAHVLYLQDKKEESEQILAECVALLEQAGPKYHSELVEVLNLASSVDDLPRDSVWTR